MTADYVRATLARRAAEQAALHDFPSVLAAIARHELPIGTRMRVGGGDDADVRLEGMPRTVTIEALADGFLVDGERSAPRSIDAGRYALRLSHQGYPAMVVMDRAALRAEAELRWYPIDERFRVAGRLEREAARIAIGSTASPDRPAERVGWLRFALDGAQCRLAVTRLLEPGVPPGHLDVYFRDATTGHGSYAVGRYATVEVDGEKAIIDFNRAYNPSCALSPHYNCPIPPPDNHLGVAITAGEMTPVLRGAKGHG